MRSAARVLVVDDEEAVCATAHTVLGQAGYDVAAAPDGAVALHVLGQPPPADLILLDMEMPVMDGWDFARAFRRLPGPHAPIILLAAAASSVSAADQAEQLGASGFLTKPFDKATLLTIVGRNVHRRLDAPAHLPRQYRNGKERREVQDRRRELVRLRAELGHLRTALARVRSETRALTDAEASRPLSAAEAKRAEALRKESELVRWELDRLRQEFFRLREEGERLHAGARGAPVAGCGLRVSS